jgi:hypothetical protein
MKQARAYGVGVLVATQNPMDLDYRALSNAGVWCIGRLQTDADRERVIEGIGGSGDSDGPSKSELTNMVKKLAPRWFLMRNAHAKEPLSLLQPRWAMSLMLGPMTRTEIRQALGKSRQSEPAAAPDMHTNTQPDTKVNERKRPEQET